MNSTPGTPTPSRNNSVSGLGRIAGLWKNIRTHDWWEYKIPPLLATAYATALLLGVTFPHLWPLLLLDLFAILPAAAYVSVLNDITDQEDDLRAGKTNRMAGKSAGYQFFALALCIVPGLAAVWFFRHYPCTLSFYAGTWVAYTLYSAPPIRLKVRGIWGVAMDAGGAHVFPTLWTATLIAEGTGHALPRLFLLSVGVWALAIGLRGILWHQLYDRENDLRSQISTLATRNSPQSIRRFVAWFDFPLELAALASILIQVSTPWAWLILSLYLAGEWLTSRFLQIDLILVQPTARYRIIFAEYYQLWYPLTFLIAMALQSLDALWLIALQLVLFPHCVHVFLSHFQFIVRQRLIPSLRSKIRTILVPIGRNKL